MTTDVQLWLAGHTVFLIACGIKAYFVLLGKQNDSTLELSTRLTKIETVLDVMGRNAAKVLHRDDDLFGVDSLLEKYLDRHYELTFAEWEELKKKCQAVAENSANQPGYRLAAAMLVAVCAHKLHLPPTDDLRWRNKKR